MSKSRTKRRFCALVLTVIMSCASFGVLKASDSILAAPESPCGWCHDTEVEGVMCHYMEPGWEYWMGDWTNPHTNVGYGFCGSPYFQLWHDDCSTVEH